MIPGGSSKEHKKKVDMDDSAESTSCNLAPWDKKLDIEVNLLSKYWEEKNNVMVLATILDPRYKMFYIDWAFKELYDEDTAIDEIADVHVELEELFDKFDTAKKMAEKSSTSSNICITSSSMPASDSAFQAHRRNTTTKSSKSELRNYLEDALEEPNPSFILLDWWKVNSLRYQMLARWQGVS
jgi:hypothetical protein